MSYPEPGIAAHMTRFLAMLDAGFIRFGAEDGMPPALHDAVQATPRHHFVHRFRVGNGALQNADVDLGRHLGTIYSDQVMRHVDADGAPLPSSNSQPSYVLWLLHMLDLRPGHRVLEIGSGSGWLAAVMADLVGDQGHVTGIEIIPGLAEQSRRDLASTGRRNVTIQTRDGTDGYPASAPFDRVIITAATWDLPVALFDQVTPDGYVLVPIELRGSGGCQVTLLSRTAAGFLALRSIAGWFVPLTGTGQTRPGIRRTLQTLPFWPQVAAAPILRFALSLGSAASDFRAFLGQTEPGFAVFETGQGQQPDRVLFGLIDEPASAMAICSNGELVGYGGDAPARRLARALARWTSFGLPATAAFQLQVCRIEDAPATIRQTWIAAPAPTGQTWVEPRGQTALVWSLPLATTAWRTLLEDPPP